MTKVVIASAYICSNFNSHAHVERDELLSQYKSCYKHFNSHAHVERDEIIRYYDIYEKDFNSHAHVERDLFEIFFVPDSSRFQLTRSRGA